MKLFVNKGGIKQNTLNIYQKERTILTQKILYDRSELQYDLEGRIAIIQCIIPSHNSCTFKSSVLHCKAVETVLPPNIYPLVFYEQNI